MLKDPSPIQMILLLTAADVNYTQKVSIGENTANPIEHTAIGILFFNYLHLSRCFPNFHLSIMQEPGQQLDVVQEIVIYVGCW